MPRVSAATCNDAPSPAQGVRTEVPGFDQFYDEHADFVWRNARRLGVMPDALDDVMQDVFLVAHRRFSDLPRLAPLRAWLFGILIRVARDYRRRLRRKAPQQGSGQSGPVTNEPVVQQSGTPADDDLVRQIVAIREARAAIRRGDGRAALAALDVGLPPAQAGPLEQERIAVRVSALCLLGDVVQAKRTAERFLTRFPDSLLAPRLRNSCAYGGGGLP